LVFFFKLGLVPFHAWLPDVYQGASRNIVSILALIPKFPLFILLLQLIFGVFPLLSKSFYILLLSISITSLIIGAFGGLNQTNFLRLLAFSSITNMGFVLFPLYTNSFVGVHAAVSYLLIYLMLSINLFIFILLYKSRSHWMIYNIDDFKYLASFELLSMLIVCIIFSNIGLPPFAGFFSKFYVVLSLMTFNYILVSIFLLAITLFTAFYYLRVLQLMLFAETYSYDIIDKISSSSLTLLFIVNIPNIWFILFLNPFFLFTAQLVSNLFELN